jgi:hypothetical protein
MPWSCAAAEAKSRFDGHGIQPVSGTELKSLRTAEGAVGEIKKAPGKDRDAWKGLP